MPTPTTTDAAIKSALRTLVAEAQGNLAGWISAILCCAAAVGGFVWLATATDSAARRVDGVASLTLLGIFVPLLVFAVIRLVSTPMTVSEALGLLRRAYVEEAIASGEVMPIKQTEVNDQEAAG